MPWMKNTLSDRDPDLQVIDYPDNSRYHAINFRFEKYKLNASDQENYAQYYREDFDLGENAPFDVPSLYKLVKVEDTRGLLTTLNTSTGYDEFYPDSLISWEMIFAHNHYSYFNPVFSIDPPDGSRKKVKPEIDAIYSYFGVQQSKKK